MPKSTSLKALCYCTEYSLHSISIFLSHPDTSIRHETNSSRHFAVCTDQTLVETSNEYPSLLGNRQVLIIDCRLKARIANACILRHELTYLPRLLRLISYTLRSSVSCYNSKNCRAQRGRDLLMFLHCVLQWPQMKSL